MGAAAKMPSYSLKYFPITALGEPIRMTMAIGGLEFEDRRIPGAEWKDLKADTPYGQMPVLTITEDDGTVKQMAQCRSILRYLGKAFWTLPPISISLYDSRAQ